MRLPGYTAADWDAIAEQLRGFTGSRLHDALLLAAEQLRASALNELDSPATPVDRTQYLRGYRAGLTRALTIPDDLARLATRGAAHGD